MRAGISTRFDVNANGHDLVDERTRTFKIPNPSRQNFLHAQSGTTTDYLLNFKMAVPPSFVSKKSRILASLSVPVEQYDDLSPKGSIDIGIRDLIDEINALEGCVTTSSCAGRISVFLEGKRSAASEDETERDTTAGVGGKGGGGRWLFVSHDSVDTETFQGYWFEKLGMKTPPSEESMKSRISEEKRFVHFKFEPMVRLTPIFSFGLYC